MIRLLRRSLLLVTVSFLLSACSIFGTEKPESDLQAERFYVIDVDRGIREDVSVPNRVVRLLPVKLTSQYRNRAIMFKVGENEFQPQPQDQFFATPEEMFTEQLQRWLEKTGIFTKVILNDSEPADMVLQTAVTALYGDKRENFPPQSVLEMQFFLLSEPDTTAQAIYQTGLRIDIDIEETTPANVVKGWKTGLKQILTTIEDDLSDYFSK